MDPLSQISSTESAILTVKPQIQQKNLITAREENLAPATQLPQGEELPAPLQTEKPRTVPVHVTRRVNITPRAQPPPTTKKSSSSRHEAKPDKGKGRKDKEFGNNSDSESEDDRKKQRKPYHGDGRILERKAAATDVGPSGHNLFASSSLTAEEQERMRLRRELRAAEDKWNKLELDRSECRSRRPDRESLLFAKKQRAYKLDEEAERAQMWRRIAIEQRRQQNFLDEALFSHIEQQLKQDGEDKDNVSSRSDAYLDDVLARVEDGIIIRCKSFDPYNLRFDSRWGNWDSIRPTPTRRNDRLIGIFEGMRNALKQRITETCCSKNSIRSAALEFVAERCSDNLEAFSVEAQLAFGHNRLGVLVDQYLAVLSERLVEVVTRDIDSALLASGVSDLTALRSGLASKLHEIFPPRSIDWTAFIDSVKMALDSKELKEQSERWYLETREKTISEFQRSFSRHHIRQKFIESLYHAGEVSLVLLKGTVLASIMDVSLESLALMGWKRTSPTGGFWRYSKGWEKRNEIFKVQMDGEVVGIWTTDGDIDWDDL